MTCEGVALFVRPVGKDRAGLRVNEGADAAGAEIIHNAVVLAHPQSGVEKPYFRLPVFPLDHGGGNTEGIHGFRVDHRHLRSLLNDLLQHGALFVDGLNGLLQGGVIPYTVKMDAPAEGGVDGLDNIVRVLVRKLFEHGQSLLRHLVPAADADHIPLEHVPELFIGAVFILQHIGVFRIVHPGIIAQADPLGDKGVPVRVVLPLKAVVEILVVIGAEPLQTEVHIPAEGAHIFFIRHLLRCFVTGDDLVDLPFFVTAVVILAVPVFEADLIVNFSSELTQHGNPHSFLFVRKSTFFAVYSTNLLPTSSGQ